MYKRQSKERLSVSESQWQAVQAIFDSASVSDETTCRVISETAAELDKLLDPHTAIGVESGRLTRKNPQVPMITLATAHPANFSEAITVAGLDLPELPAHLADLFEREERYSVIANDLGEVSAFISAALGQQALMRP